VTEEKWAAVCRHVKAMAWVESMRWTALWRGS
jgi:hypothetical protein